MNLKLLAITSITVIGFALGCGNAFSPIADMEKDEAKIDELDMAFVKGECNKVINLLQGEISNNRSRYFSNLLKEDEAGNIIPVDNATRDRARGIYAQNKDHDYKYINSVMACSGFNLLSGMDALNDNSSDIFLIVGKLSGFDKVNQEISKNKSNEYNEVFKSCEAMPKRSGSALATPPAVVTENTIPESNPSIPTTPPGSSLPENPVVSSGVISNGILIDKDFGTVCGLSSAVTSVLQVANFTLAVSKINSVNPTDEIILREEAIKDNVSNADSATLFTNIDNLITDESKDLAKKNVFQESVDHTGAVNLYTKFLTNNLNYIQGASDIISDTLNDQSFKNTINKFANDILDKDLSIVTRYSFINYFLKLQGKTEESFIKTPEQYNACKKSLIDPVCPLSNSVPRPTELPEQVMSSLQ